MRRQTDQGKRIENPEIDPMPLEMWTTRRVASQINREKIHFLISGVGIAM